MGLADDVSVSSVSTTNSTAAKRSNARAQQLQALYELSSERDLSLNKVANLRTNPTSCAPTLNTISAKDAAVAFQAQRWRDQQGDQQRKERIDGAGFEEHDTKELMADRKACLSAQMTSQGKDSVLAQGRSNYGAHGIIAHRGSKNIHHPAVAPGLQRFVQSTGAPTIVRNSTMDDSGRDDELEIRRTGSGGLILDDRASRLYADYFLSNSERNILQEPQTPLQYEKINLVTTGRSNYDTLRRRAWHPATTSFDEQSVFSTDDDGTEVLYIQRSASDGLVVPDKETHSQTKALELQSLFEHADTRDTTLNRQAIFNAPTESGATPKFGVSISPKQAAEAFRKKEQKFFEDHKNDALDPLLTKHERDETVRKLAQQKAHMEANKDQENVDTRQRDQSSATVKQPSSHVSQGYKASNGVVYDLPTLC